jgi:hypothetical protein
LKYWITKKPMSDFYNREVYPIVKTKISPV